MTFPLRKKTLQNYSENHYLKLFKTVVAIHQCYIGGSLEELLGGSIEINGQKLLKCINYSPILTLKEKKYWAPNSNYSNSEVTIDYQ